MESVLEVLRVIVTNTMEHLLCYLCGDLGAAAALCLR